MRKVLSSILTLAVVAGIIGAPAFAKDSAELQVEADAKTSEANAVGGVATDESARSAKAQADGKEGRAAKHAAKAAKEAKKAAEIQEKADKLQYKADKKAIKEAK